MGLDLKKIENDIKVEKMRKVIDDYCATFPVCISGEQCIIKDQCDKVDGLFNDDVEVLEEAYHILTEYNEHLKQTSDTVNHPSHYNEGMECIDEMILIFGKTTVANFCLCNAWKYRYRALYKNGEEDMKKSHWYIAKYKELIEDEWTELKF